MWQRSCGATPAPTDSGLVSGSAPDCLHQCPLHQCRQQHTINKPHTQVSRASPALPPSPPCLRACSRNLGAFNSSSMGLVGPLWSLVVTKPQSVKAASPHASLYCPCSLSRIFPSSPCIMAAYCRCSCCTSCSCLAACKQTHTRTHPAPHPCVCLCLRIWGLCKGCARCRALTMCSFSCSSCLARDSAVSASCSAARIWACASAMRSSSPCSCWLEWSCTDTESKSWHVLSRSMQASKLRVGNNPVLLHPSPWHTCSVAYCRAMSARISAMSACACSRAASAASARSCQRCSKVRPSTACVEASESGCLLGGKGASGAGRWQGAPPYLICFELQQVGEGQNLCSGLCQQLLVVCILPLFGWGLLLGRHAWFAAVCSGSASSGLPDYRGFKFCLGLNAKLKSCVQSAKPAKLHNGDLWDETSELMVNETSKFVLVLRFLSVSCSFWFLCYSHSCNATAKPRRNTARR